MNRLLKFGKWFSIGLFSLFLLLILTAELAEDFIVQQAVKTINSSINADIKVKEVSFSLVKRFPYASLEFDTISLKENQKKDTILSAAKLYASLNPFALINNNIKIERVGIENATCNYHINKNGISNVDFLMGSDTDQKTSDTSSTNFSVGLKKLILSNVNMRFIDQQNQIKAELTIVKTKAKGNIDPKNIMTEISGSAFVKNCSYPHTKLNHLKKAVVNYNLQYNNNKLKIINLQTESEGIKLISKGEINITDHFPAKIQIIDAQFNLSELSKYIPDELTKEYQLKKIEGQLVASGDVQGNLLDSILPTTNFSLQFKNGKFAVDTFPTIEKLAFNIQASTNKNDFSDAEINCENFLLCTKETQIHLNASASNLIQPQFQFNSKITCKPQEFKKFFPKDVLQQLDGSVSIKTQGKGKINDFKQVENPDYWLTHLQSEIQVQNLNCQTPDLLAKNISGKVNYSKNTLSLDSIHLQLPDFKIDIKNTKCKGHIAGKLSELSKLKFDLSDLHLQINNSAVDGKLQVINPEAPKYSANLYSKIILDDFAHLIPDSLAKNISGTSEFTVESKGEIDLERIDEQMMDLLLNKTQIKASCKDINLVWQAPQISINNLSTSAILKKDSIKIGVTEADIEGIACKVEKCDISNYYRTILENKKEKLKIYTDVHVGHFNYQKAEELQNKYFEWAEQNETQTDSEEVENTVPTNYRFEVKGHFSGDGVKYNKTEVSNLSSLFNLQDTVFTFNQFKFDVFKGSFENAFKCKIYPDGRMRFKMHIKNENVDFNNLLSDFDNFKEYGMDSLIRAEQVRGNLTSDLHTEFNFKDSIDMKSIRVRGDLELKNGGLYNYPAIQDLDSFTGLKNLDSMKFETIKTNLFIFKEAVYVPKTEINSNVLNIAAFGKQAFNFDCEYHLRVYLNEILNGKTKRVKKKQEQNKTKKNGGTAGLKSLFVMRKVDKGKTQNTLSAKGTRSKMKTKIKIQDEILKVYFLPMVESYSTGLEEKKNL